MFRLANLTRRKRKPLTCLIESSLLMRKRLAISLVANSRFLPCNLWNFLTAMILPLVASNAHSTVPYEPAPTSPPTKYLFVLDDLGPIV